MKKKKLMILGGSILQLPAIEKAKELGLEVIVVDMNPKAVGFNVSGVRKEVISTIDIEAVLEAAREHKIDGIMTLASDMPMNTVAKVSEELKLTGISCDTALRATNKAEMRRSLLQHDIAIPKFFKVANVDEFLEKISNFSQPFIVKPADNSGSRGIFKVQNLKDLSQALEVYNFAKSFSKSGIVVVEEFMDGPEVSVESITIQGVTHILQITDKETTGAPNFVEIGHVQPSRLPLKTIQEIEKLTIAANKALKIDTGPSHTEIIITPDGAKIVEVGARMGGDNITTHLVPLSTGVDMVELSIKIALGEKVTFQPLFTRGSAIKYFEQSKGALKKISGLHDAKQLPGVQKIEFVHGIGATIDAIINSSSRIGYVIADGNNAEEAVKNCQKAISEIEIEIEKEK